jgi:hypothetical protein
MPCYASLFIHDIINSACSLATYTFNEKSILKLQLYSMQLLSVILDVFQSSVDPDLQQSNSQDEFLSASADCKMLYQFISQILSALRPCLALQVSSELNAICSGILLKLMKMEFLHDKVALKRLLKPLLSVVDNKSDMTMPIQHRQDMSEESSVIYQLTVMSSYAQLHLLTCEQTVFIRQTTKEYNSMISTVNSAISEFMLKLVQIWFAYCIDCSRMIKSLTTHIKSIDISEKMNDSRQDLINDFDPKLGGLTYNSHLRLHLIESTYLKNLPLFLSALCESSLSSVEQIKYCFSLIQLILFSTNSSLNGTKKHFSEIVFGQNYKYLGEQLLYLLRSLKRVVIADKIKIAIPDKEWSNTVKYLQRTFFHLPKNTNPKTKLSCFYLYLDLLIKLSIDDQGDNNVYLKSEIWNGLLLVISEIFPAIFQPPDVKGCEDIRNIQSQIVQGKICNVYPTPCFESLQNISISNTDANSDLFKIPATAAAKPSKIVLDDFDLFAIQNQRNNNEAMSADEKEAKRNFDEDFYETIRTIKLLFENDVVSIFSQIMSLLLQQLKRNSQYQIYSIHLMVSIILIISMSIPSSYPSRQTVIKSITSKFMEFISSCSEEGKQLSVDDIRQILFRNFSKWCVYFDKVDKTTNEISNKITQSMTLLVPYIITLWLATHSKPETEVR